MWRLIVLLLLIVGLIILFYATRVDRDARIREYKEQYYKEIRKAI